jgi:hypothetical protein
MTKCDELYRMWKREQFNDNDQHWQQCWWWHDHVNVMAVAMNMEVMATVTMTQDSKMAQQLYSSSFWICLEKLNFVASFINNLYQVSDTFLVEVLRLKWLGFYGAYLLNQILPWNTEKIIQFDTTAEAPMQANWDSSCFHIIASWKLQLHNTRQNRDKHIIMLNVHTQLKIPFLGKMMATQKLQSPRRVLSELTSIKLLSKIRIKQKILSWAFMENLWWK